MNRFLLVVVLASLSACVSKRENSLKNTIYKFGYKTETTSTGPLNNSAFIMKVNDSLPPLFLTAHHCVANTDNGQYLKWNEVAPNMKDAWAWSMHNIDFNFKIGSNLPVKNAEALKLDVSAFYLPSNDIPYLKPSQQAAEVGDTVYLFSVIKFYNESTIRNKAVVIYATDSVMVYELTGFYKTPMGLMSGTSGSCVINKDDDVVSNSYAGFTIFSEEDRRKKEIDFPLISKLNTEDGKTYGVGVPIKIIKESLIQAFESSATNSQ